MSGRAHRWDWRLAANHSFWDHDGQPTFHAHDASDQVACSAGFGLAASIESPTEASHLCPACLTGVVPLSPAELAVCANVGGRLARGEIDAPAALRWLQGWSSTPVAADAREGVAGDRAPFTPPLWPGAALPSWMEVVYDSGLEVWAERPRDARDAPW